MKDPLYYVVDDVLITHAVATLTELMRSMPELHWMALVDGAFDYPHADTAPYRVGGFNCFDAPEFEGLQEAAPWLAPIASEGTADQLRALLRHCQGRPMLSFIATHRSAPEQCAYWQPHHKVKVVDEQKMLLRFTDSRVLAMLPAILTDLQWATLADGITHWVYYDRAGRLARSPGPTPRVEPCEIVLTAQQLDALLSLSRPDAMLATILESLPDVVPEDSSRSERYSMVANAYELARRHDVTDDADIFSLAVAACLTAGSSNTDVRLTALLGERRWPVGSLGEFLVDQGVV